MTYCSECGKEVPSGAKFCWNCGAPVALPPGAVPETKAKQPRDEGRPFAATALALLSAAAGVGIVVLCFLILLLTRYTNLVLGVGIIVIILGALPMVVSYGLWTGKRWVRLLGTWSGVVFAVLGVLVAVSGGFVIGLASVLFGAGSAFYLGKRNVREYLERAQG